MERATLVLLLVTHRGANLTVLWLCRVNEENLVNGMMAGAQAALDALQGTQASDAQAIRNPDCPSRRLIAAKIRYATLCTLGDYSSTNSHCIAERAKGRT